jgi:hypothetical protein
MCTSGFSLIEPTRGRLVLITLTMIVLNTVGCGRPVSSDARVGSQDRAECVTPDSPADPRGGRLHYSDLDTSRASGDVSGKDLVLVVHRSGALGTIRFAEGQLGAPKALTSLQLDPQRGRISFAVPAPSGTSYFRGRFSCDSIWGTWLESGDSTSTRLLRVH